MKSFKNYQHQQIIAPDGSLAHGSYVLDEELTIRVTDGYLNDTVDTDGNVLPAIELAHGTHIEHWKNGVLHCENEPAVIDLVENYEEWWNEGKYYEPKN